MTDTLPRTQLPGPGEPPQDRLAAAAAAQHPHRLVELTTDALSGPATAIVELPGSDGVTAAWPDWVHPAVRAAVEAQGITALWRHQQLAAQAARDGRHVVVATGTASGKSLAYWLPALSAAVADGATTLYCTPTKALAQDQQARLAALALPSVGPACYDGDTDRVVRPWIRRSSRYVLTNPDMLHRSILPRHPQWRAFLSRLRYVVLDESHLYRGVFGAHVAAVIARLRRLCALAGSDPAFILSSATLGDPLGCAEQLLGVPRSSVTAVADDTSARGPRTVVLVDPTAAGDPGDPAPDRTAFGETAAVLAAWARHRIRSVGFLRSRAGVEALAQQVRASSDLPDASVTAYRGGLLPEERRAIERRLRSGELRCVASTNALELGVDIAGLDAVAMCGWPGTRLSFLQQLGRAGRTGNHAVAVLAAQADPLDRFYAHHPERLFGGPIEAGVLDRDNPYVLVGHVACAVAEQPLTDAEGPRVFGPTFAAVIAVLAGKGLVRQRGDRWFWVAAEQAHRLSDLRGCGAAVTIVEAPTGRVMGTVDGSSAPAQLHPGAVYTHLGVTHLIETLDLEEAVAVARPARPGYSTVAQTVGELRVRAERGSRALGAGTLHHGDVEVTSQVVSFLQRASGTGRVLGSQPLELPPRRLLTRAVWWRLDAERLLAAGVSASGIPGAAHAAEHAAIGVLPALATCDRWDVGGMSTALHPDTGGVTVFVHDGHPGGAGFARRAYEAVGEWLAATRQVIATCDCASGCPGCVQSPKCGSGNEPLDKRGAVAMLDLLLDK